MMNDPVMIMEESRDIKLLYVEDDPVSRAFILEILKEFFSHITIAENGIEGLKKFKEGDIDLIISDINMPKMNGFEMIDKIRESDNDISIIILSAYSESEYFIKGIEQGVDGYLLKPFNLEQFLAILSNVIKGIRLRQEVSFLQERMDLALEGGRTAILDWDLSDNSFYISPCWKEMLGFSDEELANNLLTWKERVHRDDRKSLFSSLRQSFEGKIKFYENTHRLKHKDGKWIWILGRAQIQYDKKGKVARMIGTHTDITEEKELQFKSSRQVEIIAQIYDGIISTDLDGMITSWNDASEALFGYKAEEVIGQHSNMLYLQKDIETRDREIATLMRKGKHHITTRLLKKSREIIYVDLSLTLIRDNRGNLMGKMAHIQDVGKRKEAEVALIEQHKYLQSIIDSVHHPIMVIKEDYTVDLMNSVQSANLKNLKIADLEHPKCYEISHNRSTPCDGFSHPCPLRDVIDTKAHISVVHDHYNVAGEKCYVEISATPLFDDKMHCIGIIESQKDVTEHLEIQDDLEEQKNILHHQAHHDVLTGLPNRVLFNDRLKHGLERSNRNGSGLALFFIDIDHFKEINDTFGHSVGDEVLKSVTQRLSKILRKEDTLARLGGDEFTLIMEGLSQVQDASLLGEKVREVLREPISVDNNTFHVSSSIGISLYPDDADNIQDMLKYADIAMYKAKEEGRNNFQFYSVKMTELSLERVLMEAGLREAFNKEEFVVYYQPLMNAKTNVLIGVEALVRWQHPTIGVVSPENFIYLLEKMGLMIALDNWVMKTAMSQMAIWYKKGLNPGILSVNLSLKQLQEKDFIGMLEDNIDKTGCSAAWIELEVTEEQIMKNSDIAPKILAQISDLGVNLAIDDFGTGYSSLSYLKHLYVNTLKIDRSFVRELPNDKDEGIIKTIIALAKSLNFKVIAEGVETEVQRQFLLEQECFHMQGYLFGKPMPSSEIEMRLK